MDINERRPILVKTTISQEILDGMLADLQAHPRPWALFFVESEDPDAPEDTPPRTYSMDDVTRGKVDVDDVMGAVMNGNGEPMPILFHPELIRLMVLLISTINSMETVNGIPLPPAVETSWAHEAAAPDEPARPA